MRCNNCGFDNEPGVGACVKCGHPLQSSGQPQNHYQPSPYQYGQGAAPQPRPTVVGAAYGQEPQPRATVMGAAYSQEPQPRATVMGPAYGQEPQPRPTVTMNGGYPPAYEPDGGPVPTGKADNSRPACPRCGYQVSSDYRVCPSCGYSLVSAEAGRPSGQTAGAKGADAGLDLNTTCDKCGKEVPVTFSFCPYCSAPIRQKTVFVRRHHIAPPKPKCSLTLISEEGEQVEERKNSYEGEQVMLNRANTEPDNLSITSKEQAELLHEDGKWYVLNHSEMCTTSVEAGRKIEIQPDDIIVLGDRRFRFSLE